MGFELTMSFLLTAIIFSILYHDVTGQICERRVMYVMYTMYIWVLFGRETEFQKHGKRDDWLPITWPVFEEFNDENAMMRHRIVNDEVQ